MRIAFMMGKNGERLLCIMIADCAALRVKVIESSGGDELLEKLQTAGREACAKIRGVIAVDDDGDDGDDDERQFVILRGERSAIIGVERYT